MMQTNSVSYLAPHKFISRKSELGSEKPPKQLVLDPSSSLTLKNKDLDITCDTSTELLLREAFTRRALAMDLVGACSYSVMEGFNRFLMAQSSARILHMKSDKEAWLRLAEKATDGIRRTVTGALPLDALIPQLESDPRVVMHVLPLPAQPPNVAKSSGSQQNASRPFQSGKVISNFGKGKGKRKWKAPKNMPQELSGKQSQTKDGTPICWNFNLKHGCKSGLGAGKKCERGMHVCMVPGCQKAHAMHEHEMQRQSVSLQSFLDRAANRVKDRPVSELYMLEIFCGTGRLCGAIRKLGLSDSLGIDNVVTKGLRCPILRLDLTKDSSIELIERMMEQGTLCYIHLAPPCGTSSRARHIKKHPRQRCPPPCRSDAEPEGFNFLKGTLRLRVKLANHLYSVSSKLFLNAWMDGIFVSVENPGRSYFWSTSHWLKHTAHLPILTTLFHHCQFG